jgi:hypothetical protein
MRASKRGSGFDVVDGARSRRTNRRKVIVATNHIGNRPHADYHNRFGYRQELEHGLKSATAYDRTVAGTAAQVANYMEVVANYMKEVFEATGSCSRIL